MNKSLLSLVIGLLLSLSLQARDFTFTHQENLLTYYVIDEASKTCGVKSSNGAGGEVAVPLMAKDGSTEYLVTEIGRDAFNGNNNVTAVTLPSSITSLGDGAFRYCKKLATVNIPEGISTIPNYAFEYCFALTTISLPASLTEIKFRAFSYCKWIEDIFCQAINPPSCTDQAFQYVPRHCRIHVEESAVPAYQSADTWREFNNIKPYDFSNIAEQSAPHTTPITVYDLMGRPLSHPTKGIIIVNGRKLRLK